ncbi:MAG: glycosyltransferase family 4 protein [Candidatus Woesearchaeota archaeon]
MRICVLSRSPVSETLGTDASFVRMLEKLSERGHKVHSISYKETKKEREINIKNVSCEYIPLTMDRGNEFDKLLKTFIWILIVPLIVAYKHFFKNRFDVVHCNDNAPVYWYLIKKFTRVPVALKFGDIWSLFMQEKKSSIVRFVFKLLFLLEKKIMWKSVDRIQPHSLPLKKYLLDLGLSEEKLDIAPETIDFNFFKDLKIDKAQARRRLNYTEKDNLIVFHGFIDTFKRVETLIYATPIILEEFSNSKIVIVGDGTPLRELKRITQELKLEKNILFTGWVEFNKLLEYVLAADIAVSLRGKNFANNFIVTTSALQDLAAGKALVAPKLAAQEWLFGTEGVALLYEPEDPEDLAEKIMYLIKNPQARREMGLKARGFAKNHDKEIIAEKTVRSIEKTIKKI